MWIVSATWSASLLPGISQWRPVLPLGPHARHHAPLARTESLLPNPLQTEAIRSDNSAVLVLASPGTGKTRVLRARMAYLLISKGVPSDRILTVAFSQHAVSQLRTRVGAFTDTKGMWLGTFHSICARMVRQHHELLDLPRGFTVLPEGEQRKIVRELVAREQSRRPYALPGGYGYERDAAVLQTLLLWKEKGLRPAEVPDPQDSSLVALARAVYPEYQRALRARDALDYPDLTLGALRLFQRHPHVLRAYRAQFDHILCDELQDTSAVQYEWLRRLASPRLSTAASAPAYSSVFCAADDDQAIYAWRGAERNNVLRFQHDFPGLALIRLPRTYRCSPHVLGAAQALIAQAPPLVPKTCFSDSTADEDMYEPPRVVLRGFWDSGEEVSWLAAQISARHATGERYAQMAVLVRSAEHARAIAAALMAAGVPVTSQAEAEAAPVAWWASAEVASIMAALRLVRSTADDSAAAVLLGGWGGLSEAAVRLLSRRAHAQQHSLLHAAHSALLGGEFGAQGAARLAALLHHFARWQAVARRAHAGGSGAAVAGGAGGADGADGAAGAGAGAGGAGAALMAVLGGVTADYPPRDQQAVAHRAELLALASGCGSLQQLLDHRAKLLDDEAARRHAGTRAADPAAGAAPARGPLRSAAPADNAGAATGAARRAARRAAAGPAAAGAAAAGAAAAGAAAAALRDGQVSVMTVHRSKGLEWDTVFLPGWEEGTFPPQRPSAAPRSVGIEQPQEEEWRLAYVALTRCRALATITFASRRRVGGTGNRWETRPPSPFIQVMPSTHLVSFAPNCAKPYYRGVSGFRATNSRLFARSGKAARRGVAPTAAKSRQSQVMSARTDAVIAAAMGASASAAAPAVAPAITPSATPSAAPSAAPASVPPVAAPVSSAGKVRRSGGRVGGRAPQAPPPAAVARGSARGAPPPPPPPPSSPPLAVPAVAQEAEAVPNVASSAAAREAEALSVLSALTSRAMDAAVGSAQRGGAGMAPSGASAMNSAQAQAVNELEFEWGVAGAHAATELEFEWGMESAGGSLESAPQLPIEASHEASAAVEASAVLSMLTSRAMDAAVGTAERGGASALNAAQAQAVTELEFEWGTAAAPTELEFQWGVAAPSPYTEPFEWTPGYRTEDAYGTRGGTVEGAGGETEYEWRPSRQP